MSTFQTDIQTLIEEGLYLADHGSANERERGYYRKSANAIEKMKALRAELSLLKEAIDASGWHDVGGERMKRILIAKTSIGANRTRFDFQ